MPLLEELETLILDVTPEPLTLSSAGSVPPGDGYFVSVGETGGLPPVRLQNQIVGYERPSAQITVRHARYYDARILARALYRALNLRNQLVGAWTKPVTSMFRSGSVATATVPSHGCETGQSLSILGASPSAYNGTFTITHVNQNAFSFPVVGAPTTPASGVITASFLGTWYLELEPIQEPFDMGVDANGRARVVFNVRAVKSPS